MFDENTKAILLKLAENTLKKYFKLPFDEIDTSSIKGKQGSFVTLKKQDNLRGCIGYLIGIEPLVPQIKRATLEAAFKDYRFPPLEQEELKDISIEISLLSKPKKIKSLDEFVLGRDGILLNSEKNHSVFLPQVATETGWNKEQLLERLCNKADLDSDAWRRPEITFFTFTAEVFSS